MVPVINNRHISHFALLISCLLIKKYRKLNRTSSYGNSWVTVRTTPLEKKTESAENPQFFFLLYLGTLHTYQYSYIQKAVLQNRYPGFRT